jgi:hypothetical protein
MCPTKSTEPTNASGFVQSADLATSGCLPKPSNLKETIMEFKDYSTILMDLERTLKSLDRKCLEKKYDGYIQEIGHAHQKLSELLIWIAHQQVKK